MCFFFLVRGGVSLFYIFLFAIAWGYLLGSKSEDFKGYCRFIGVENQAAILFVVVIFEKRLKQPMAILWPLIFTAAVVRAHGQISLSPI